MDKQEILDRGQEARDRFAAAALSSPKVYRFRREKKRPAAESRIMKAVRKAHPVCEACQREPTRDAHHIVSEKSGGPTEEWNLLALCYFCHVPGFHTLGWVRFCDRYPHLAGKVVAARIKMGRKTS